MPRGSVCVCVFIEARTPAGLQVCKYFLCGFCPSSLFANTKSDLGECRNLHDEKLRAE